MSMFVTVAATIKVKLDVLADNQTEGLEQAKTLLLNCRLLKPTFWQRTWVDRVFTSSPPWDAASVAEVVSTEVISAVYAGGE
jgi:hypothetical protein